MKNDEKNQKPFIPQEKIDELYSIPHWDEYYKELLNTANEQLARYIQSQDSWRHPFMVESEAGKAEWWEGCQWVSEDVEASLLSKTLFFRLILVMNSIMDELGLEPIDAVNAFDCTKKHCKRGEAQYGDLLFHFDVMNNPKAYSANKRAISKWRIGYMTDTAKASHDFTDISHTIGNFAPIPWWIKRGRGAAATDLNLQTLHNDLAEWWDMLLLYLQWRMPEFSTGKKSALSFVEYLILTCQFFYVDGVCDELNMKDEDFKKFCKAADDDKDSKGWTNHTKEWIEKLKKLEEKGTIQIISLMSTEDSDVCRLELPSEMNDLRFAKRSGASFKESYWRIRGKAIRDWEKAIQKEEASPKDEGPVSQANQLISRLIELRGRCIMGLLKENQGLIFK